MVKSHLNPKKKKKNRKKQHKLLQPAARQHRDRKAIERWPFFCAKFILTTEFQYAIIYVVS